MKRATIDEVLQPGDAHADAARAHRVMRGFWRTVRRASHQIPFAQELVAAYYCALDPATPLRVRGTLLAALAYFVLPFDIVPDLLFGIGFTDDIAVLTAAIASVRSNIRSVHREQAQAALIRFAQSSD